MSRWAKPADHEEVAARVEAKKHQKRIEQEIDRAAADENVDFDALASKLKSKLDKKAAEKKKPK